jgi:hypothetical protein
VLVRKREGARARTVVIAGLSAGIARELRMQEALLEREITELE